jgi:Ca2+-binding RTX toxin-like protein
MKIKGTEHADSVIGTTNDDTIKGGRGHDYLDGLSGADVLIGGRGADFLYGSLDNDILVGGKGRDVFFLSPGDDSGLDAITDFDPHKDRVFFVDGGNIPLSTPFDYNSNNGKISLDGDALAFADTGLLMRENSLKIIGSHDFDLLYHP